MGEINAIYTDSGAVDKGSWEVHPWEFKNMLERFGTTMEHLGRDDHYLWSQEFHFGMDIFIFGFPLFSSSFLRGELSHSLSCPLHSYSCLSDPASIFDFSNSVDFVLFVPALAKLGKVFLQAHLDYAFLAKSFWFLQFLVVTEWIMMTPLTVFPSWPHKYTAYLLKNL